MTGEQIKALAKAAYCDDAEFDSRWQDGDFRTFCAALLHEAMRTQPEELSAIPEGKHGEIVHLPDGLHRDTQNLVMLFAGAMAYKLNKAQDKYGYDNGWKGSAWEQDCRDRLHEHLAKGDPRDVANYCAFMWHHGWATTAPDTVAMPKAWVEAAKCDNCGGQGWKAIQVEAGVFEQEQCQWCFEQWLALGQPTLTPSPHMSASKEKS